MTDHDRLFKELLTTFFLDFLRLFLPDVAAYIEPDSIEFLDKEIFTDVTAGEKYEVDVIARAKFRGQDAFFLLHVEDQSSPQTRFARRMFFYSVHLDQKYDLPVYPIALFSYDAPRRLEPHRYQVAFPNKTVLTFDFDVIQLNRLDWQDYMNRPNPVAAALMAKMHIAPRDRPKVKAECLRLLATLRLDPARMQLISGFVDTYLRLNRQEQQVFQQEIAAIEPPEVREEAMQITTSWKEEGIEEGMMRVMQRQLRHKFGELEPNLNERIEELSLERLGDLTEALLDFQSKEDLTAWLDRARSSRKPRRQI